MSERQGFHVAADYLEEGGFDEAALFLRGAVRDPENHPNYGVCVTDERLSQSVRAYGGLAAAILREASAAKLDPRWPLLVSRYRRGGVLIRAIPGDPEEIVFDREFYLTPQTCDELRKHGDYEWRPFRTEAEARR